ncbi:hypothetical protein HY495_01385 [Candidatus Woesearchaeota archaeon]|nr:hypothetical protein [Candidatus Woesearchaeota archaeon]
MIPDNGYVELCSPENLLIAYQRARKGKTRKEYVLEFEKNLQENLLELRNELLLYSYQPRPLKTFIIRDPKVRKISKSHFRDRIVHHALCNIIEPYFERQFIYDSYANRKSKGTLKAIERFNVFSRKVSRNHSRRAYVLKADIKQYFETVDHQILQTALKKEIKDKRVLWLISVILSNYEAKTAHQGMPLGNLTSQFFANVFLNELDQFVKQQLRAKYYIRYVDDFVIIHQSKDTLINQKAKIDSFLREKLKLTLHPDKSKIIPIKRGVEFLGLKIFFYHKILRRKNLRRFERKLETLFEEYDRREIDYDIVYDFLEGWLAYTKNTNTYKLRKRIMTKVEEHFQSEMSTKEYNRYLRLTKSGINNQSSA